MNIMIRDVLVSVYKKEYSIVNDWLKGRLNVFYDSSNIGEALIIATACNDRKMINLLLKNGVDINTENKYGESVVTKAVIDNNISMFCFLLEKNAYANARNRFGINMLKRSLGLGDTRMTKILVSYGAKLRY